MNSHSRRLVNQIYKSFIDYQNGVIDESGLLHNVEGNLSAIEEKEVQEELNKTVVIIEEARWIYEAEVGRNVILKEVEKISRMLEL